MLSLVVRVLVLYLAVAIALKLIRSALGGSPSRTRDPRRASSPPGASPHAPYPSGTIVDAEWEEIPSVPPPAGGEAAGPDAPKA